MKTNKLLFGLSALIIAGCLTFTSCKKKTEDPAPEEDTEQATANDNNTAEAFSSDLINIGSQASENGGTSLNTFKMGPGGNMNGENMVLGSGCATITPNVTAKTFTVDFGNTACLCSDGRYRSGKLIYNYSASTSTATAYRMPGFAFNVSTTGSAPYIVDGYTVNIVSKTISNTTPLNFNPSSTNLSWQINSNIQISKPGGGSISWTASRTKTLLNTNDTNCYKNQSTPIKWTKAKISISGTSSGTNAANLSYNCVSNNLVRDFGACSLGGKYPFISGTIQYTPTGKQTRYIVSGARRHATWVAEIGLSAFTTGETEMKNEVKNEMSVFPNPSNDLVSVTFNVEKADVLSFIIYDAVGREVKTLLREYIKEGKQLFSFSLEPLPKGIYLLKISSSSQEFATQKLVRD